MAHHTDARVPHHRQPTLDVAYATAPRPGKLHNEDLVGTADGLFFVLDGSSVPPDLPACCDRDAAWYVRRLAAGLVSALAGNDDLKLAEGLARAIETVAAEHHETCPVANPASLGPSAAIALTRQRNDTLDYLLLGDVALLLETASEVTQHCDRRLSGVASDTRARIRAHLEAGGGYTEPAYRNLVLELVAAEREARNSADGYWIASNQPAAAYEALTASAPLGTGPDDIRTFALLSDGLARSVDVLGLHQSWRDLLTALTTEGPAACIAAVRQAEAADPGGQLHVRTSASDDASAMIVRLSDPG